MAETLSTISIVSFVAAGVFAVLAIALWFIFKIPTVIGDLSGRNAKKSIEQMRKNNEKAGNKSYKSSGINAIRGKLTGTMEATGKEKMSGQYYETGLLNENMALGYHTLGTGLLVDENVTGKLEDTNETAPLEVEAVRSGRKASNVKIIILDEIMYIHTEEVI